MGRIFTLDEAKALMPQVKANTEPVYALAASLAEELSQAEEANDEARAEDLRERLQTLVQLYKALGGGWNLKDPGAGPHARP